MNNRLAFITLIACALAPATAPADEPIYNGHIHGMLDGQVIDVPAVCTDLPGNGGFNVISDPNHMGEARDVNGDGVAVVVNGVVDGNVAISARLGEQHYTFGGRGAQFTDQGLRFVDQIYRMDKTAGRMVPAFEVDLDIQCDGQPTER